MLFRLLLLAHAALAQIVSLHSSPIPTHTALVEHRNPYQYSHPAREQPDAHLDDLELLDIVLLASVDGKLHALNRTSGETLWSMTPSSQSSSSSPAALSPLVRTDHIEYDPDVTDDNNQAAYIIEPQSGDIYIMPNPSSPLQRFPFSMQELVDMSPFSFRGENDSRVFVGKKETSLLAVELQTGKIKATLNSECPWDQFDHFKDELDLDELEDSVPPKAPPAEVYIGRTDYHVSIIPTRSTNLDGPVTRPPIQNLSFSTYGPNREDSHIQSLYRRTKDNTYILSLPSGELLSFKAKSSIDSITATYTDQRLWGRNAFSQPIVAVFDVVNRKPSSKLDTSTHPFVLLQPRPRIQDIIPGLSSLTKEPPLSAYIGLVEETGSLFALTPDRFPLVAFGRPQGQQQQRKVHPLLDDKDRVTGEDEDEEVTSVDEITRRRKLQEAKSTSSSPHSLEEDIQCHASVINDRRCLVGIHRLELNHGDGHETRMKRLLDASPDQNHYPEPSSHPQQSPSNESKNSPLTIDPPTAVPDGVSLSTGLGGDGVFGIGKVVWTTLILGFFMVFGISRWRNGSSVVQKGVVEQQPVAINMPPNDVSAAVSAEIKEIQGELTIPNQASSSSLPTPPVTAPTVESLASTSPTLQQQHTTTGDDSDKEDLDGGAQTEGENDDLVIVDRPPPTAGPAVGRGNDPMTPKKKTRRGKRGSKKPKNGSGDPPVLNNVKVNGSGKDVGAEAGEEEGMKVPKTPSTLILASTPKAVSTPGPSLLVSDTVLGYGSHGTVVYKGSLQGRAVAVKRLLADFVTLASREVSILQESDDHPNVIRYYYQEAHAGFLYIALELCPASLADLIETPDRDAWRDIAVSFDPKRALKQVTNGLRHLHALKLVHRDIKPQNILVSTKGGGLNGAGPGGAGGTARGTNYRMLISDFGLCKKLDVDQTSFLPTVHGALAAGTVGWRAPEILRGEVNLDDEMGGDDQSSRGSGTTIHGCNPNYSNHSTSSNNSSSSSSSSNSGKGRRTKLTKSVDIFALGCLYYYTLTGGGHPFGDRYEREVNIIKNAKNLDILERFGEEGTEAANLIEKMLDPVPSERPDTTSCLLHPFFWDPSRRLNFLQEASDRFDIMCRDPKDPDLLALEENAQSIIGNDWHSRMDRVFMENLGKYRKYDGKSVQDLLRALRNKKHHYQDLPDNVKRHLGNMPEGFLAYFTRRFPELFLHVHRVVRETGLQSESVFRGYFELSDS